MFIENGKITKIKLIYYTYELKNFVRVYLLLQQQKYF